MKQEIKDALNKYNEINQVLKSYFFAMYLTNWDNETAAGMGTIQSRGDIIGTFSKLRYELVTGEEYNNVIDVLCNNLGELDDVMKHEIYETKKNIEKQKKVPMEETIEYSKLMNEAYPIYVKAKLESNYELFKPYLAKIIEFQKRYIKYQETDELKGYDVLLDEYEHGMTTKEYDVFFNTLKEKLVPFIKAVSKKKLKYNRKFTKKLYPADKQEEFCKYLQGVMEFDPNYTIMKVSEHPFTSGFGNKDVRITTNYHEDLLVSSIFSAIHEMGHGLYELHVDDEIDKTMSGGGASMAMHESQSRFMENIIGRSDAFWETHYEELQSEFSSQLKNVSVQDFIKYVNEVKCDFIRTEADELTYSLHIMVRYEIEKKIFSGKVSVDELPELWNRLYKKYLGVKVSNDKEGILQDVHWAGGSFGYFPTYALGSAYAAQFYNSLQKDVDVDKAIRSGKLTEINQWLKENIHKYGSSKYPDEIIKLATKEEFNPEYYVNYLINKYSKIYEL